MAVKFTIQDFNKRFKTEQSCLDTIAHYRYENFPLAPCIKCKKETKHHAITNRRAYACQTCGSHLYPLAGTIFEKSTTPLKLWFYAMFLIANTRSGISAKQLERELGVTYKTAWRMFKQIRTLMADGGELLSGDVEIDETYVGGKGKNRRYKLSNPEDKQVVMGMVERGGTVRLRHIPNAGKWTLIKQIKENVDPYARVFTDEWRGYHQLTSNGYNHSVIPHKETYVRNEVHTQNIENVWSHLKRGIYGVYRVVSKKYLQAYADEYAFRYNHRKSEEHMFETLLKRSPEFRILRV